MPPDTLGLPDDFAIDYVGRFLWGPKTSTWVGTAISLVGPTGPALLTGIGPPLDDFGTPGQAYLDVSNGNLYAPKTTSGWAATPATNIGGTSLRYGQGAPAATLGMVNDSYIDLAQMAFYGPKDATKGWPTAPISLIGPQGPPGASFLTSQSAGCGTGFASVAAISATPQLGMYPGTTQPVTFAPNFATAFMGLTYSNINANITLTLFNQTTNSVVWSGVATGNLTSNTGPQFSPTQYPMPANNVYVWQLTGAASTANIMVTPLYLWPAASPAYNISQLPTCARAVTQAFTATAVVLYMGASTLQYSWRFVKASYICGGTITNNSTGALNIAVVANGVGTLVTFAAPANSITPLGPFGLGTYTMGANTQYYMTAAGSGTGTVFVDLQVAFNIA